MRIIHTADWHIGQTLDGHARDHEHRAVLAQLVVIAQQREADALVVAGDIFDHMNPSGDSQRLLYDTLVALKRARPRMTIVVTAGNHDAAGRLEAPHALLAQMGVHVVGNIRRRNGWIDAARHLIALPTDNGEIAACVLAVSFPTAACLPASRGPEVAQAECQTRALYDELMDRSGAARDGLPLIVTGHLHVAGGLESEGAERRVFVGGQHAVTADVFPGQAAYVALGHLHKAQAVGRDSVRYSGSLLPLSATELGYTHGITLVTLDGCGVRIEPVPVTRPVAFLRLPERGDMRLDELGDRLKALAVPGDMPPELRPFVQPCLTREGLSSSFRAEVDTIAEAFAVRIVKPRVARTEAAAPGRAEWEPRARLADRQPEDLFRQAFERARGAAPGAAHLAAFHAVEAAVATES